MEKKSSYQDLEKRIHEFEKAEQILAESERNLYQKINVLTNPSVTIDQITFEDLFSIKKIQHLQNEFAVATGVASIITKTDGTPITEPSNFCRLCMDIIRKTEKGVSNCFKSDALIGRHHPEGPIVQPCISGGLWDAGAGITVGGKHIANWLIGQVRDEKQTEAGMAAYARKIGVDEAKLLTAFREVPSMSKERFDKIAQMLFTLAKHISDGAYQNLQQARIIAERKKVEEALLISQEKYRSLVEASSDFIWEIDKNRKYTYVSPKVKSMLGYEPDEIIGKTPFETMPDAEAERAAKQFAAAIESGLPIQALENENIHKNGTSVILETNGVPIFDASGKLTGYRGIDRDITLRRETEMDLRQREALLNSIFISAPVGIGMVVDRKLTFVNQRCCDMVGYTSDELEGQLSRLLYPDQEEFDWVGREKYEQIAQKGTGTVETRWKRKDGKLIDVLLSSTPIDLSDWSKGVTFSALDISERKIAKYNLQESQERFRFAFHTSPDAININRLSDGIYIDINEGFTKLLGYTREDVIGKSSIALNIWKNIDDRNRLVAGLTQDGHVENLESEFIGKDGTIRVALMSASITQLNDENIILSVTRDITERKKVENELKKYREHLEDLVKNRTAELEAKNKELEVFTYSVSHDLKAPLRGIDGYSRLLVEEYADKLDGEGLLFLNNVRQSTTQMNQLIEDLLSYSRMERRDLQPVPINLHSVIDLLIAQREHEIKTKQIEVSVNLPFQTLTVDSETLRQVLGNYLDNAIKFLKNEKTGKVDIGGQETEASWTLWVRDNGIGFDPQYHDRIFNIFQRLHRAEDFPGTGIGLAIVRKAIERIGGRVWAESKLGEGAAFFIDIPKKAEFTQKEKLTNEPE